MRLLALALLLVCLGCGGVAPRTFTPEERKVIAVAQDHLMKTQDAWGTPVEVKPPPNRVNVPEWKKYVEDEGHIWKLVYETPREEMRAVGARTLFVNVRTNEVTPSVRK